MTEPRNKLTDLGLLCRMRARDLMHIAAIIENAKPSAADLSFFIREYEAGLADLNEYSKEALIAANNLFGREVVKKPRRQRR